MVELNMNDQMGYGIQRMYETRRNRYLPMPDYELSRETVEISLYGGVVDVSYSRILMENSGLFLTDMLALGLIQKRLEVPYAAIQSLKRMGLVEGRKLRFRVSAVVAVAAAKKAEYIKIKAYPYCSDPTNTLWSLSILHYILLKYRSI